MNILEILRKLLLRPTKQKVVEFPVEISQPPSGDRVAQFNELAPPLFGPRLEELSYKLNAIENSKHRESLWSTHHYYQNKKLNLTLDIQQAPYYTDYGFSIFIFDSTDPNKRQLLCNVPHEIQDKENNFLIVMCDKIFADPEIISLLKGQHWRKINPLYLD